MQFGFMKALQKAALAGAMAVMAAAPLSAATITFDFAASGGTNTGTGFTNTRTYSSGGVTLTARGFSLLGGGSVFSNSQVGHFSGNGLGACNQNENTGCGQGNHQVDNSGGSEDFILFQLAPAVVITSVRVQTHSGADTDVTYFLGNTSNPLNLNTVNVNNLGTLGFNAAVVDNSNSGTNTVDIGGSTFNSLLFGARRGQHDDAFKIRSMVVNFTPGNPGPTPVPAPMALSLLGVGLLGLGIVARRRRA
jgi:hypothetical protein